MRFSSITTLAAGALFWSEVSAIVGGRLQDPASRYLVSVRKFGFFGDSHACGGTIIGPKSVLTAAHCVDGTSASLLEVKYGGTNRNNLAHTVKVAKILKHPRWGSRKKDNDYAVLHLTTTVFGPDGSPMTTFPTLPETSVVTGADLIISGWGKLDGLRLTLPSEVHTASMAALDADACEEKWSDIRHISTNMACMESKSAAFCNGDDGGPVMDAAGSVVVGVISWGADGCPADTTVRPNVYADTAAQRNWVMSNVA